MKIKGILLASAVLLTAACASDLSHEGKTLVICDFGKGAPETVKFEIDGQWDTVVNVVKGSVKALLPIDTTRFAYMQVDADPVSFVSDGSLITIDTETGLPVSDDPAGMMSRLSALSEWERTFMENYEEEMESLSEEEQDAYYDQALEEYNNHFLEVLSQNTDNVLGWVAVTSIFLDDDVKMLEALNRLSDEIRADDTIQHSIAMCETRIKTGAGNRFVDFSVVQDPAEPKETTVMFSDYAGRGKYLLVDFWASWCGPCKAEIPNIAAVYEKYKGKKFNVLSIAVWDEPEKSKAAAEQLGIKWDQIINAESIPTDIYGIEGIPHIMLIGPDGTIIARGLRGADIEKAVSEALASAKK